MSSATVTSFETALLDLPRHPVRSRRGGRKRTFAPRGLTSGPRELRIWEEETRQIITVEFTDAAVELMERFTPYLKELADAHVAEFGGPQPEIQEAFLTEISRVQMDAQERGVANPWAAPVDPDAPTVGRNDPCPCGSGRKFKQCHGG